MPGLHNPRWRRLRGPTKGQAGLTERADAPTERMHLTTRAQVLVGRS